MSATKFILSYGVNVWADNLGKEVYRKGRPSIELDSFGGWRLVIVISQRCR